MHGLNKDQLVECRIINPYWQILRGEKEMQRSAPVASSDLTHFRRRIGRNEGGTLAKTLTKSHLSIEQAGIGSF